MPDNLTPDDLVRREVHYCVSSLVATLANAVGGIPTGIADDLSALAYQASELSWPLQNWEAAANEANFVIEKNANDHWGWRHQSDDPMPGDYEHDSPDAAAIACCEDNDLQPVEYEVYEHWIVSDWLADKLEARGEKVDRDFAGMTVWARTTTGQAIACDSVIESICRDLPGEIEAALAAISTPKVEG